MAKEESRAMASSRRVIVCSMSRASKATAAREYLRNASVEDVVARSRGAADLIEPSDSPRRSRSFRPSRSMAARKSSESDAVSPTVTSSSPEEVSITCTVRM
jgi:hypothetical protein